MENKFCQGRHFNSYQNQHSLVDSLRHSKEIGKQVVGMVENVYSSYRTIIESKRVWI